MVAERRNTPEQERSIKDRGNELFVEPEVRVPERPPVKPFEVYLRETPAEPMSTGAKVLLWVVGVVVLLLFVAALWRIQRRPRARPRAEAASPATGAAWPLARPTVMAVVSGRPT